MELFGIVLSVPVAFVLLRLCSSCFSTASVKPCMASKATTEHRAELTTTRFVLRPVTEDDERLLHELWSSAGVRRFLWDGQIIPIARTRATLVQSQRLFGERHFGLWGAWSIEGSPTLAGFGGLWPFREPPELKLLYGVAEPLWGRGYATEIAKAIVEYCFDSLGMSVLRASTDVGNVASIRVLEKLGFSFVRRGAVGGLDTVFYELSRRSSVF
jgi:[ribosomal protein S5]-alanine N-acetyltransferase